MPYKRMKLIPKPGPEVTVIASTARPPIDGEGKGNYNFVCGHCEEMLAKKVWSKQALQNLVILCPNCGQYNATEL